MVGSGGNAARRDETRVSDLVSRQALIEQLQRELFDELQASGASRSEIEVARDLGYRRGHNDRARSLIRQLEQGRTLASLRELRDAVPTVTEATSIFHGEGG